MPREMLHTLHACLHAVTGMQLEGFDQVALPGSPPWYCLDAGRLGFVR